ncbi:Uncharacterized protein TPAR_05966 [Tolypocladium paradoxum]|uniref:Ecp2 effector protein-like domain-containing protein n=1 Tax=Tolypocladium paradoxum TaxID=94208 RepID=A0A2S4KUH6_9HYPO|nr:Uncharacterized protein TPAR_05966 [Tolypocladium paradoxum]
MTATTSPWPRAVLCVLLLVNLAAFVAAAGGRPPFTDARGVSWTPSATHQSTCDQATFAFDSRLDPADWRQCVALASAWGAEKGTFRVAQGDDKTYRPILHQSDCTLAVEPMDAGKRSYTIGDEDVKKILDNSLKNFSHGTLLAVGGVVKCDVDSGGRAGLAWRISKAGK